ncbi:hypothetical protein TNCV_492911 [Trichonephila clavipes]|nr:hypothetical protein TNCV_492911 [Trichonephila clavipes]
MVERDVTPRPRRTLSEKVDDQFTLFISTHFWLNLLIRSPFPHPEMICYALWTILDRVLGARAAGVHYRLFSVWTLVPVRRDQQLSDHSDCGRNRFRGSGLSPYLHNGELSSKAVNDDSGPEGRAVGACSRTPAEVCEETG